ncbi:unnamed protein product, partial [Ilex paraguariensis]
MSAPSVSAPKRHGWYHGRRSRRRTPGCARRPHGPPQPDGVQRLPRPRAAGAATAGPACECRVAPASRGSRGRRHQRGVDRHGLLGAPALLSSFPGVGRHA